jgi:hypothetical protein
MKTTVSTLRALALFLALTCTTVLLYSGMAAPAAAHEDSTRIACDPAAAYQAVLDTKKGNHCINDALALYPGYIVNHSVVETPGCGPLSIRGCTYAINIWISCPFPGCLAPDILVLDATVSCTFEVTSLNCLI